MENQLRGLKNIDNWTELLKQETNSDRKKEFYK